MTETTKWLSRQLAANFPLIHYSITRLIVAALLRSQLTHFRPNIILSHHSELVFFTGSCFWKLKSHLLKVSLLLWITPVIYNLTLFTDNSITKCCWAHVLMFLIQLCVWQSGERCPNWAFGRYLSVVAPVPACLKCIAAIKFRKRMCSQK